MDIRQTAVPSQPVTAVLKDATMLSDYNGRYIAGDVFWDLEDRWKDGTRIFTTYVTGELTRDTYRTKSGDTFYIVSWKQK